MKVQFSEPSKDTQENSQFLRAQLDMLIDATSRTVQVQSYLPGLTHVKDQLTSIITGYEVSREEINTDRDLTSEAKLRKNKELKTSTIDQINGIKDLTGRQVQIENQLFVQKKEQTEGEKILQFLRDQEIRKSLEGIDNLQLTARLHELMEKDPENALLDAVIGNQNPLKQYIGPEDAKGFMLQRAEHRNPELAGELRDVSAINDAIASMKIIAKDHIA